MKTVKLGINGPSVTALCMGAWSWGDKLFWNYGSNYGAKEVEEAFMASIEGGVTFFDTAEVYGNGLSETLIGEFAKKTDRPLQIATKYGPMPWRLTGRSISDALTASLARLKLDKITLYQVHWPFTFLMDQQTLMNALAAEVKRGRIEAIGVSNYSAEQMQQAHKFLGDQGIPLAVNQVRYSLLSRKVETLGIIETAKKLGVTILAYSPLEQGLLTGKYTAENTPTGARKLDSRFTPAQLQKIAPVMSLLRKIGERYDKTPAQVSLNWLITKGGIIPIAGVKNATQVKENLGALRWSLSQDEIQQLDLITRAWL